MVSCEAGLWWDQALIQRPGKKWTTHCLDCQKQDMSVTLDAIRHRTRAHCIYEALIAVLGQTKRGGFGQQEPEVQPICSVLLRTPHGVRRMQPDGLAVAFLLQSFSISNEIEHPSFTTSPSCVLKHQSCSQQSSRCLHLLPRAALSVSLLKIFPQIPDLLQG